MTSQHSLLKNRGEWAEIVAVFACLSRGRVPTVKACETGLKETGGEVIIAEMSIERANETILYRFNRDTPPCKSVSIYINNNLVDTLPMHEVSTDSQTFIAAVKEQANTHKKGNFSVPAADVLLKKYHLGSGKTKSTMKQDVDLILIDPDGIPVPKCGFSIKSFVGGNPTIFNASRAARFNFRLDGSKAREAVAISKEIHSTKPKSWVQILIQRLYSIHALTLSVEIPDRRFERNLELLDANMPSVIGALLLNAYCTGEMALSKNLNDVILRDPMGFGKDADTFYTYRVKHFLRAAALGFSSSKPWNGQEGADGGMLFVSKAWNLYCLMSSRKDFEDYLIRTCRFESPSSSVEKHGGYGHVFEEWHGTYVDLLLQVREEDPFKKGPCSQIENLQDQSKCE